MDGELFVSDSDVMLLTEESVDEIVEEDSEEEKTDHDDDVLMELADSPFDLDDGDTGDDIDGAG